MTTSNSVKNVMVRRDYYLVLGVGRTADAGAVRRAFKERALDRHPGGAGLAAADQFREVTEAYRVLADPQRREVYDSRLRRQEAAHAASADTIDQRPPPRPAFVEPRVPPPTSLFHDFDAPGGVRDETFARLQRNFTGFHVPKAERLQALDVDVAISRAQAVWGGVLAIGLPVFTPCPACEGSGMDWFSPCALCGAAGTLEDEVPVAVELPALVGDGTLIEAPLDHFGIHNTVLRARVRVTHFR